VQGLEWPYGQSNNHHCTCTEVKTHAMCSRTMPERNILLYHNRFLSKRFRRPTVIAFWTLNGKSCIMWPSCDKKTWQCALITYIAFMYDMCVCIFNNDGRYGVFWSDSCCVTVGWNDFKFSSGKLYVTLCSFVDRYQRFGGTCCLHFQVYNFQRFGRKI
jgi:hypothetical protein